MERKDVILSHTVPAQRLMLSSSTVRTTCAYTHTHTHTHTHAHTHTCTHTNPPPHTYAQTHTHIHTPAHTLPLSFFSASSFLPFPSLSLSLCSYPFQSDSPLQLCCPF